MSPQDVQCPQPLRPSSLIHHLDLGSFDRDHRPTKRRQHTRPEPPSKKRCLEQSPSLASQVHSWLSAIPNPNCLEIPRPNTAPPPSTSEASRWPPEDPSRGIRRPKSARPARGAEISTLSFGPSPIEVRMRSPASKPSTTGTGLSTSDSKYRDVIISHNIILDVIGAEIEQDGDIQELLDSHILKSRPESPPLSDEDVAKAVKTAAKLLNRAEGSMGGLTSTKAFPLERPDSIEEGNNIQWSSKPLPTNRVLPYRLAAPKPDRHFGYPSAADWDWTNEEMAVFYHPMALHYTQPARNTCFPFLALELKSEATGGSLHVAENQGVSSGVHMVASLRWILSQAFPTRELAAKDAVAFVGAVSQRTAVFYIVWYSNKKKRYVMSMIKIFSLLEGSHIRPCRDLINNIIDYGSGERLRPIKTALTELYPVPADWDNALQASNATETPAETPTETPPASSIEEETPSSNKRRKK
ncbi:hypothetical protein QQZ08_006782 [Neonectria magnoliae]|uniref:DUF7924 domain-containing protein n=1 Tax=Neonectria magnoliae TaxID=2732573 RepID=A0ABR1HZZ4_9HYPO